MSKRGETAGALRVVLEKQNVGVEAGEDLFRDRFVAAFAEPFPLVVPAAEMHCESQPGRPLADRVVEEIHVAGHESIRVVTSSAEGLAVIRIAEKRERDRVELNVARVPIGEVFQLFAVDARDIAEELVQVRVDGIGHPLAEPEEMLGFGARKRTFGVRFVRLRT